MVFCVPPSFTVRSMRYLLSLVSPPINTAEEEAHKATGQVYSIIKMYVCIVQFTDWREAILTNRVAEIRRERGMSQEDLAEKAGISRPYLSQIETQRQQTVSNVVMFKIAEALNEKFERIFLP